LFSAFRLSAGFFSVRKSKSKSENMQYQNSRHEKWARWQKSKRRTSWTKSQRAQLRLKQNTENKIAQAVLQTTEYDEKTITTRARPPEPSSHEQEESGKGYREDTAKRIIPHGLLKDSRHTCQ
jgi:hypothetical protein